jgi:hypothetical protein
MVDQNNPNIAQLLAARAKALLATRDFLEAVPGHLLPDTASQQRLAIVVERIKQLTIGS